MTLPEVIRVWISGRSPESAARYQTLAEYLDDQCQKLFKKSILKANSPELMALFRLCTGQARTISLKMFMMKSFFRLVKELGLRPDNPMASIKPPKFEDKLAERIIGHDDVQKLIGAARTDRDRMLMQLLYGAGLRIGETLALKKKDILGNGAIRVFGKGQKTAYVRVSPTLEAKLQEWVDTLPPEGYLFTVYHNGNKPMSRNLAWHVIKQAAQKAGLPKVSPHWLRHAHASEALSRGASIVVVKQSLRHSSIETTMKYLHVQPKEGSALFLPPTD